MCVEEYTGLSPKKDERSPYTTLPPQPLEWPPVHSCRRETYDPYYIVPLTLVDDRLTKCTSRRPVTLSVTSFVGHVCLRLLSHPAPVWGPFLSPVGSLCSCECSCFLFRHSLTSVPVYSQRLIPFSCSFVLVVPLKFTDLNICTKIIPWSPESFDFIYVRTYLCKTINLCKWSLCKVKIFVIICVNVPNGIIDRNLDRFYQGLILFNL